MKLLNRTIGLFMCLSVLYSIQAQDSAKVFDFKSYLNLVKQHHPLAKQAQLQLEKGEANVLKARGGFDPKISTDLEQKYYKGSQYYSLFNSGLKIPTWYGLEFGAGFEQNQGLNLNPENIVPQAGLAYAGVSLTLGKGLFIDERRFALKQAKIFNAAAQSEQMNMLNDLLNHAGKAYWDWYLAYQQSLVFKEAFVFAQQRFEAVKQAALLGDRPFVDTLEAGIQLQERRMSLGQANLDYKNKTLYLSVYLWYENETPLELEESTVPMATLTFTSNAIGFLNRENQLDSFILSHPEMQLYRYKLDGLGVEKRMKQEQLKPLLNIKYNPLLSGSSQTNFNFSMNNYSWGMGLSMPIFLRKERGDLRLMEVKIQETELATKQKNLELNNKAQASINDYFLSAEQLNLYTETVKQYAQLLEAEKQIFNSGESSLFMINAREISYLTAKIKWLELQVKNQKAILSAYHSLGILQTL
jgi:outer membrane protein TolC